jgi:hypothetical protein
MRAHRHRGIHKSNLASYTSIKSPCNTMYMETKCEARCCNDLISGETCKASPTVLHAGTYISRRYRKVVAQLVA